MLLSSPSSSSLSFLPTLMSFAPVSILPPDVPGALAGAAVVIVVDGLADLVVEVHLGVVEALER